MRADLGAFVALGKGKCHLVVRLMALLVALSAAWACSAGKADAGSGASQLRRGGLTWLTATHFARPRFRPTKTVDVHTAAEFWRAWAELRSGEEIDVHGVTFAGEAVFQKSLRGPAEIHFDRSTRFVGTPGSNRPAAWIDHCRNIRFYGGNLTNPRGGTGVTISDSSWVTWWNFVIHDTANTGLSVRGIHRPDTHLDLRGEIYHWGLNLALDTHIEKGTGLHGANLGDSPFGVSYSRFALNVHDGVTGAGVEAGGGEGTDFFVHNTLYLRCRDLTKVAIRFTAGNCVQLWGINVAHNNFRYIDAANITGRPFETSGMYDGQSLRTNRVDFGRAWRTNLNLRIGPIRWDRRGSTIFKNVLPAQ